MALIAISIAVNEAEEIGAAIERAAKAAASGAKLVEWRIDGLAEQPDAADAALHLIKQSPLPCIITCRPTSEGGDYEGDEQTRISLLETLACAEAPDERPRYVDVELAAYQRSRNFRQKVHLAVDHPAQPRDLDTSLILSIHDFRDRPANLLQRIEAMSHEPACAVIKIAWLARSLRDNLEAFELLANRTKPMIALCMGPFGLMSRVLAGKFGGFLSFASDAPAAATAPGQPTLDELRRVFHFERIHRKTLVHGVIGWPVEHSLGPVIHNAGFQAVGHDGVYLPLPVPGHAGEYEHFKATVGALVDAGGLDFRGASITLPHKENLLRFVRERGGRIDPLVERIGAANTLLVGSAGALECLNTDCSAAVESLRVGMGITEAQMAGKRIAVLGAGGAARAVVAGLSDVGAEVVIFNRSVMRAQRLVDDFNARWTAAGAQAKVALGAPDGLACGCFHAFVNCTPVGMAGGPAPDDSPLEMFGEREVALDENVVIFDTVYAPERTPMIQEAESRGGRVITGMDMFLRQAALQFERWTGVPGPIETFRAAIRAHTNLGIASQ